MSRNSSGNSSASSKRKRGRPHSSNTAGNPRPFPATPSWGANSPSSSSRSSSRKAPFSDFGSYMSEKNRKLQEQFDASASASGKERGIFHGVSIFVDGLTVPSHQDLKGYMLKHGGRFENYFSKQRVTHIICSNLPDSKWRNFRSFSRGLPVVKPAWILDSIAANKLLRWAPYQLDEPANEIFKQQKLSTFFSSRKKPILEVTDSIIDINVESRTGIESVSLDADGWHSKTKSEESEQSSYPMRESSSGGNALYESHSFQSSLHGNAEQVVMESVNNQIDTGEASTVKSSSKQLHSTLSDPDFVKNYFKNSRLHFIGTWRSRYHKRFLAKSNEAVTSNNNIPGVPFRKSAIIHIDMDCFFVSVILRNHLELIDKPVAVCHSDNPKGTAEISSANYPARQYGIRAGMFVRTAKALCPNLVIFPYDFDAYEEVADQFYTILHKHCPRVQAISCDEAFLDVTNVNEDPESLASMIRREIVHTTGCSASAGIAENLLLARLATRSAKPNGQCSIPSEKIEDYLKDLPIQALPGIGHALEDKLKAHNIHKCGQLRVLSKDLLQKDFGSKTGDMLWSHCRGIDNRMVESVQETKSVGAEVNWGVRFKEMNDFRRFLKNLCEEVSLRLLGCGMRGRTITLKVKKRMDGAEEPTKYMGCGQCKNMSRSLTVPAATDSSETLERISRKLFASFHIDVKEVRGVGLQISRLEHADARLAERSFESWLSSASKNSRDLTENATSVVRSRGSSSLDQSVDCGGVISGIPPLCNLDKDVIRSLPREIIAEYNDIYNGGLSDILQNFTEKDSKANSPIRSMPCLEVIDDTLLAGCKEVELENATGWVDPCVKTDKKVLIAQDKGKQALVYHAPATDISTRRLLDDPHGDDHAKLQPIYVRGISERSLSIEVLEMKGGSSNFVDTSSGKWHERTDLIPYSLSQVDASVLQQLPEDLRADILEVLPAHCRAECSNVPSVIATGDTGKGTYQYHLVNLWEGDPPRWVHDFRNSSCLTLVMFAEAFVEPFYGNNDGNAFSSLLQNLVSRLPPLNINEDEWGEAFSGFSELFIQYIKLKVGLNIEEVYLCFSLLRRFAQKSILFSHVHDRLLPSVQAYVGEVYGGRLKFPASYN